MTSTVEDTSQILLKLLKNFQEDVEAAIETLEIMQDKELLEDIREALKDAEDGKTKPLDVLIKELNLEKEI